MCAAVLVCCRQETCESALPVRVRSSLSVRDVVFWVARCNAYVLSRLAGRMVKAPVRRSHQTSGLFHLGDVGEHRYGLEDCRVWCCNYVSDRVCPWYKLWLWYHRHVAGVPGAVCLAVYQILRSGDDYGQQVVSVLNIICPFVMWNMYICVPSLPSYLFVRYSIQPVHI